MEGVDEIVEGVRIDERGREGLDGGVGGNGGLDVFGAHGAGVEASGLEGGAAAGGVADLPAPPL